MSETFPPPLTKGSRVWTEGGFSAHGPLDGPKVDIQPRSAGTVISVEQPYPTVDQLLFGVEWDPGQKSKHYGKRLYCIGRFASRAEFENAIALHGTIDVTVGPQGGFRQAKCDVSYEGVRKEVVITDRDLWLDCLEPLAIARGIIINTIKLRPALRRKRS